LQLKITKLQNSIIYVLVYNFSQHLHKIAKYKIIPVVVAASPLPLPNARTGAEGPEQPQS
jgi:hypothetical protein